MPPRNYNIVETFIELKLAQFMLTFMVNILDFNTTLFIWQKMILETNVNTLFLKHEIILSGIF